MSAVYSERDWASLARLLVTCRLGDDDRREGSCIDLGLASHCPLTPRMKVASLADEMMVL